DEKTIPDGGKFAWLCLTGTAACFFTSWGWINCVGVFQEYYKRVQYPDLSHSTIGWISATEMFCMLFSSPVAGTIFDNHGPRQLLYVGTFLHVFGLMMASISTQFYQTILSQGICSALGAGLLFNAAISCVATWWDKKRGMAMGITAAGSSLGGVLFPIIVSKTAPKIGFPWAMRTCTFIILALLSYAIFSVKSRVKPTKRPFKATAFLKPLRELPYALFGIAYFFLTLGILLPLSYLVQDAHARGMGVEISQYLVSLLNAGSFFGRIIPGLVGDRIGRFNTMIVLVFLATIFILGFWIPAKSNAALIAFAPCIGAATGASISLPPAMIGQISDIKEIGVRSGTMWAIGSFGALIGPPLAGALIGAVDGDFWALKVFGGGMCLASALFFVASRVALVGTAVMKKV
ncbi:MFS transporter, MCP family, solute carrier family 16, member 10, partial [Aaosphaeria arxii CBS 175.79]